MQRLFDTEKRDPIMKNKLTMKETIIVASTLFGMFFGAGNLIFPVHLGQMAGSNSWPAIMGFVITAVGIPILAVAAIGNTHSDDLLHLSGKVSGWYGVVFTTILYLTIGPFFAIPRCATVSFTTGIAPMISEQAFRTGQFIFTFVFFAVVLFFSLKPSGITTWIGRIINPMFLAFLALLIIVAMIHPGAAVADVAPEADYVDGALFNGFVEGYGTMDAIAGLAFGIVIIGAVRDLGISDDGDVARETLKAGIYTGVLMAVIYLLTILMGAQSRGLFETSDNGAIALTQISSFACLKTALGLVTSCSEMFVRMFPGTFSYRGWAIAFTAFSFVISNVGLTAIINYAVPFLMLLYPLVITLVVMALAERTFGGSRHVYRWVTAGAFIAAIFDFAKTLPEGVQTALNIPAMTEFAGRIFPFFDLGLGWVVPSLIGLVIGLIIYKIKGTEREV